jgi:hypothetical protein
MRAPGPLPLPLRLPLLCLVLCLASCSSFVPNGAGRRTTTIMCSSAGGGIPSRQRIISRSRKCAASVAAGASVLISRPHLVHASSSPEYVSEEQQYVGVEGQEEEVVDDLEEAEGGDENLGVTAKDGEDVDGLGELADFFSSSDFRLVGGLAIVGAGGVVALKRRAVRGSRGYDRAGVKTIPPPPPPAPKEMDFDLFGNESVLGPAVSSSKEEQAVEAVAPAEAASPSPAPAPASSKPAPASPLPPPAPAAASKKLGGLGNIFKKDKGPQRATTLEAALEAATASSREFALDLAATLGGFAPQSMFPSLKASSPQPQDAAAADALVEKSKSAGLTVGETADLTAEVVNAMVVALTDAAVGGRDEEVRLEGLNALLDYMEGAGSVFASLCPGVEVNPPIRYNGSCRRGKLEDLFKLYAVKSLTADSLGGSSRLDQLQDLFSIKDSKANGITQKVLMDSVMKMMKEGGGEGLPDMSGMMEGLGGMFPGGQGGGGGAPGGPGMMPDIDPKEMAAQMNEFKEMVKSGNVSEEEVKALRSMYKEMGMDIDDMCRMADSSMAALDPEAKEMFRLLKGLLSKYPKGR